MVKNYFLNLCDRLSQIYLHKYSIILALVILKVYLFKNSIIRSLDNLLDYSGDLCDTINSYSSNVSELPSELSSIINSMVVSNLNHLTYSWLLIIKLIITIIKNLFLFYLEICLGTFTCLLTAAVNGTVNFALDSTESIIVSLNSTIVELSNDIDDGLDGLSNIINKVISAYKKIKGFFSGNDENYNSDEYFNKINLSISSLKNLSIPSSVLTSIEDFKKEVPDFSELENSTKQLISAPFNLINKEIKSSKAFSKNLTVDNLPQFKNVQAANLCDSSIKIDNQIKKISSIVQKISTIIIISLILLIILDLLIIMFIEVKKWKKRLNLMHDLEECENTGNVLSTYSNLLIYYIDKRFKTWSEFKRNNLFWLINYLTSSYSLNILMISLIGFLTILLQSIILANLKLDSVISSSESTSSLNRAIKNNTFNYINEINSYLGRQQNNLNDELFGYVKNSSVSLNSTINDFLTNLNDSITEIFHNTPFESPINTVVYCVIGRKLSKLEKGLTWLNDNLKITIPKVSKDLVNNLTLSESSTNKVNEIINKSFNNLKKLYKDSLWLEFIICICLFGLWMLQLIIGLIILFIRSSRESEPVVLEKEYNISDPKPLSDNEKQLYGYPLSDPYNNEKIDNSSSIYSSSFDNNSNNPSNKT